MGTRFTKIVAEEGLPVTIQILSTNLIDQYLKSAFNSYTKRNVKDNSPKNTLLICTKLL